MNGMIHDLILDGYKMKRIKVQIAKNTVDRYASKKQVLVRKQDVTTDITFPEGTIMELRSGHRYVGTAYYGLQNKGIGWMLSFNEDEAINPQFFQRKIHAAIYDRLAFFKNHETNVFRVFNGEGDGIGGLTIDYYDGFFLVTLYSDGINQFFDAIIESIEGLRHIEIEGFNDVRGIYVKRRFDDGGQFIDETSYYAGAYAKEPLIVRENGVNYATYLDDGAMTGIFLDQKVVRGVLKNTYSKGKTVLNTFSYTGAFSVAAAAGGATHTTSVDLANRSLERTKEQFDINGLNAEYEDIIIMDVFDYFKYAIRKEKKFDVVILDPPAFAKSKKLTFSVQKHYTWLIENAIQLTDDDGLIIASTNSAALSMDQFTKQIAQGFSNQGKCFDVIETFTLPEDFKTTKGYPQGNYLKVLFLRVGR